MTAKTVRIKPIYVIYGPVTFLRRRALDRIVQEVSGGRQDQISYVQLDGESADGAEVLDELRTASLFGGHKLVVVRDAEKVVSANRRAFERYLQNPVAGASLVLMVASWPSNTKLAKRVAEIGVKVPCQPPSRKGIPGFLVGEARNTFGKSLDPRAAERLQELIGNDVSLLFNELEKVSIYVGSRDRIDVKDIEVLCCHCRQENIFAITDAMADGRVEQALSQWRQLSRLDQQAQYRAIGALAWGIRRLLQAQALAARGVPTRKIFENLKIFGDTNQFERRLKRLPVQRLQQCVSRLLQADYASKTGLGDAQLQVEKLIVEIATQAAAPARGRTA